MTYFTSLYAHYYELLYSDKNYEKEVDYIKSFLSNYQNKESSILDLGCGTGNHAEIFASSGYSCTGIDSSKEMINIAKEKLSQNSSLQFYEGDASDFNLSRKFDFIVSLFHVFSYLHNDHQVKGFFKSSLNHLCDDGLLLFDYWNKDGVLSDPPVVRNKFVENDLISVKRTAKPLHKEKENIVEIDFNIEIFDKKLKKTSPFREKHTMRYFSPSELDKISETYDLEPVGHYKWLTKDKPNKHDWYAFSIYKKRKNNE